MREEDGLVIRVLVESTRVALQMHIVANLCSPPAYQGYNKSMRHPKHFKAPTLKLSISHHCTQRMARHHVSPSYYMILTWCNFEVQLWPYSTTRLKQHEQVVHITACKRLCAVTCGHFIRTHSESLHEMSWKANLLAPKGGDDFCSLYPLKDKLYSVTMRFAMHACLWGYQEEFHSLMLLFTYTIISRTTRLRNFSYVPMHYTQNYYTISCTSFS